MAEDDSTVRRSAVVPACRERAWLAVSDADQLSRWWGATVELEAAPGGLATFRDRQGRVRRATVDTVEPSRRLVFRWWPAGGAAGRVEIALDDDVAGTRVTVTETTESNVPAHRFDGRQARPVGFDTEASLAVSPR